MTRPRKLPDLPRRPLDIAYKDSIESDLQQLTPKDGVRVLTKLEAALRGEGHKGEALVGKFKGLFKLRVGDYRVIYVKTARGYLVLRIGHRREVYAKGL